MAEHHRSPCWWRHRSRWPPKFSSAATVTPLKVYLQKGRKGLVLLSLRFVLMNGVTLLLPQPSTAQHGPAHLPSLLLQECLPADGLGCWIPIRSGPGSASPVSIPPTPLFSLNSPTLSPSVCVLMFQSADGHACVHACVFYYYYCCLNKMRVRSFFLLVLWLHSSCFQAWLCKRASSLT